jgi:hypothetical protein
VPKDPDGYTEFVAEIVVELSDETSYPLEAGPVGLALEGKDVGTASVLELVEKAEVPGGTTYEPTELAPDGKEVGTASVLELDSVAVLSEGTMYPLDAGLVELAPESKEVGTASVLELVGKAEVPEGTTYDGPTELVKDVGTTSVFEAEVPDGAM